MESVTTLLFALPAALGGWLVGGLSAWITARYFEDAPRALRPPVVQDLLVQAGVTVLWVWLLLDCGLSWRWAASALLVVPLVQVAVTDLRTRYVYTLIAMVAALGGIGANLFGVLHPDSWVPLLTPFAPWSLGLAGAVGSYLVFTLIYYLGRLVYRGQEPLAHGDVTIAAMVGAIAGPYTIPALILGTLASGVFAIGALLVKRSVRVFIPYGPGLCFGAIASLFWP